ncbi:hypothetical protein [Rugosimonospora africana]|uniref:Uncharacterized protein n=1 Tax=Rugosimonospora africana TaxID=556532 RepID=A0A8J3QWW3_9ACTN|nr:hypothetical protein [Rugosimonospora africana]GIH18031.1 hypothetical protein Raf01_62030 [Rugosimonospora africana]
MRHRRTAFIATALCAVAAAGTAVAIAAPASAALTTSCTGTASDVTVPNDLFVPANKSCDLTNVTINGATTVRGGGNLLLTDSRLNGTLTVQDNGFVDIERTTVTGAVKLNSAFGGYAENSTLGANVTATSSGFFYSIGSSLVGVSSTNGETYLESARMSKNLTTSGDVLTDVYNSVIEGTVDISGAQTGSVVCTSEVDGNASISGSTAADGSLVQVGASAPLTGCGFDVFAGNLALTGNASPVYVSDNVVRDDLTCTGNASAPVGSSSRIRGQATDQCAPAPAGAAAPNARTLAPNAAAKSAAPATSRGADALAAVKSRGNSGTAAAHQAGRAAIGS